MSTQILVNASEFEKARSSLLDSYCNLQAAYQKLVTGHAALCRDWEGQSGTAFQTLSEDIERLFLASNDQLKEMIAQMDMAEKGFTDLDNELKARFAQ